MPSIMEIPAGVDAGAVVAALVTRGQEQAKAGQYDEAYQSFGQALALEPESPLVLINYGAALADGKKHQEAHVFTSKALDRAVTDTQRAICLNNLGHLAHVRRDFPLADALFRSSLNCDRHYKPPLISLGANLVLQGRWDEAYHVFDEASLLYPGDWEPLMNRAIVKLTQGDWRRGLPGYEHRKLMAGAIEFENAAKAPRWNGEDLTGQAIAIWPDQGLGDCVYCHRLVGEVARRAGHVYFMTYVPLDGMLPVFPNVTVLREGDRADCIHRQAPIMSLMHCLRIDPLNPPAPTGLVFPEGDIDGPRRGRTTEGGMGPSVKVSSHPHNPAGRRSNIGLCLSGNPSHKYDDLRSIPVALFAETVIDQLTPPVNWHWLGKDMRPHDEAALGGRVIRHRIENGKDLAALTAAMDLVVSVDTLTLHVAGELGKPTFGLIPFSPDFRWLTDREDCPWYPSVRLLRCAQPVGGWPAVLSRLRTQIT